MERAWFCLDLDGLYGWGVVRDMFDFNQGSQ
jgi:hypothetical protein